MGKKEEPAEVAAITGQPLTAEGARQAGVLADPAKDAVRALYELQALVMCCPQCQGAITQAIVDAGTLG